MLDSSLTPTVLFQNDSCDRILGRHHELHFIRSPRLPHHVHDSEPRPYQYHGMSRLSKNQVWVVQGITNLH